MKNIFKGLGIALLAFLLTAGVAQAVICTVMTGCTGVGTLSGLVKGNGTSPVGSITTSSGLAGVITDETGSGALVFSNSPVFTTPNIGTATGSVTGNAATATALQNARLINGVSFNGTSDITVTVAAGTLTGSSLASGVTTSSLTSFGSSPTISGHPTIEGVTSTGATGSGKLVFGTSPDFTTGITIGSVAVPTISSTSTLTNKDLTSGTNTFPTFNQNTTGSAATLTTARTIGILTGDATSAGSTFNGSANNTNALTLATVNTNTGTFGSATQSPALTVNGKGLITAVSNTTITPAVGSITGLGTGIATFLGTPSSANLASAITDETGSGSLVFGTSPTLATAVLGSSTATTQSPADNSTKVATTAYVDNAVLGQDFKQAAVVGTTGNLIGLYLNGSSGVGATFTYTATGTDAIDGVTLALGNRVLVKNQTTTFQNGVYSVTTAGAIGIAGILTRTTDFDQSADVDTGDSIFVSSGTTQTNTTWAYNGVNNPAFGTDAVTFAQTAGQGSFTGGNGIAITGTSIAIDTSITVDKTTSQTLTNKTLTSAVLTTPVINGTATGTGVASANTASALVIRDSSGNFSAGTITAALSGNATTATALATGRTISITGDLTYTSPSFDGSGNVTAAGTLATVNANVGSFGSATQVGTFTVNGKGLITAAGNTTVTPAVGSITGLGTGVATALGVNVGSSGAFVTNGGALGTPSSGTVTNLTGTASININGTVGATTPAAGTFTSVTDSGLTSGRVTFAGTSGILKDDAGLLFATSAPAQTLTIGTAGTSNDVGKIALSYAGSITDNTITLTPAGGSSGAKTITIPNTTDTLVGKATTDTLTNKTTTGLKADGFLDTNGNKVVEIDAITAATGANFFVQKAAATGQAVPLQVTGSDTDVYLNLITKGAGTVRANGVDIDTISGTQTLTNKTLTSSTNILGGVTMTLGSDASNDIYYRNSSGILTRLANGTTGQYLAATTGAAPSWGSPAAGLTVGTSAITGGSTGNVLYDNAGVLGEMTTTGSGTVNVLQTAPTFLTSITDPLVIGGTGTTSPLTLRSTSGTGTTGADIVFQTGTNGATEVARFNNNGDFGFGGTANAGGYSGHTMTLRGGSTNIPVFEGIRADTSSGDLEFLFRGGNTSNSALAGVAIFSGTAATDGELHLQTSNAGASVADGLVVNSLQHVGIDGATINSFLSLPAGTTAFAPLTCKAGSLLTSSIAGAVECDSNVFYTTPVAGARGVSPSEMYSIVPAAGFNLATAAGVQSAFPTTADVWTLAASTTYAFQGQYQFTKTTTSTTTQMAFALAGGATITSISYNGFGGTVNANAAIAGSSGSFFYCTQISICITISSPATSGGIVTFSGIIRMNAGGTVTPQIDFTSGATAPVMTANSYITFTPMGTSTQNSVGNVN